MKTTFDPTWPRRVATVTLGALIAAGALLLLSLVLELQNPVWSRPAIVLQLLAIALASAALRAPWRLSRRFVAYPLILVIVIYLWDSTLPPPTLPEGLLRGVAPRLVLLGLVIDLALWQARSGGARAHVARLVGAVAQGGTPGGLRIPVRRGLVPLDEAAKLFRISAAALRTRLERVGGAAVWEAGLEQIRLGDLLQIVSQWEEHDLGDDIVGPGARPRPMFANRPPHSGQTHILVDPPHANGRAPARSQPRAARTWPTPLRKAREIWPREQLSSEAPTLPRRLHHALGIIWMALMTIVAIPPGIELRLLLDGHPPSAAIFACLHPWVGVTGGAAALLGCLTLFLAIWVLPTLRPIAALAIAGGALSGVGIGLLIGVPCI